MDQDTQANIYLNTIGAESDPLTELRSRTNFGRPNFSRLFGAVRDGIQTGDYTRGLDISPSTKNTVGVYFCGPNAAARDIKSACKEVSTRDVGFRFWKEHF